MDKEWVELIKEAKAQGMSQSKVREQLFNQSQGTKFIQVTDDAGRVLNRVLEVSGYKHQAVISMAIDHLKQHYINMGWDSDKEMTEYFKEIVKVDNVLKGIDQPEYKKVGELKNEQLF